MVIRSALCLLLGTTLGVLSAEENTVPEKPKIVQLPVFSEGPGKGFYALYQHRNFEARIDAEGVLHVQIREGDKPIGAPIIFNNLAVQYTSPIPTPPHTVARRMISIDLLGEPLLQPSRVVIKGMLEDNVAFYRQYDFKDNQILACGGYKDPGYLLYPSYGRLGLSFPPSHSIPPKVEQPERLLLLKGCVLKTKEMVGKHSKKFEHLYAKILEFGGPVEEAEASGPWGPRSVRLTSRNFKNFDYVGQIYERFCPWEGYGFLLAIPAGDLAPAWRAILTIE